MSYTSENIQRLSKVDLIVSDYEWTCPHCGKLNSEPIECIIVGCCECDSVFRVNQIYEE